MVSRGRAPSFPVIPARGLAIASAAAATLLDGRKIFMGSGSTLLYLAQRLDNSRRLIVVTDAINIATELLNRPSVSVIQVGGETKLFPGDPGLVVVKDLASITPHLLLWDDSIGSVG